MVKFLTKPRGIQEAPICDEQDVCCPGEPPGYHSEVKPNGDNLAQRFWQGLRRDWGSFRAAFGELPTAEEFETWRYEITHHTFIHENVRKKFLEGFHHDAHPMAMMAAVVSSLSAFFHDRLDIRDYEHRMVIALISAREAVTVPLGTFQTYRVDYLFVFQDGRRIKSTFWYQRWRSHV